MKRGEVYKVSATTFAATLGQRLYVVVSRQVLIDSRFATVACAPIFNRNDGLATQVPLGKEDGLKKDCCIHADELVSLPKSALSERVGMLTPAKLEALNRAISVALDLPPTLA